MFFRAIFAIKNNILAKNLSVRANKVTSEWQVSVVSVRLFVQVANNFSKIRFRKFVGNAKKRFFTTAEFWFNLIFVEFGEIGFFKSLTLADLTIWGRKPYDRKMEKFEIAKHFALAKKSSQDC